MESLINQDSKEAQPVTDIPEEEVKKPEVLQLNMPLDFLLNASRKQKKEFFKNVEKNIKARVEMIRQQRRIKP